MVGALKEHLRKEYTSDMEEKYIKLSNAKKAIEDYRSEITVSKYGSLESSMDAKFAVTGAMKELDYIPTADVVPKSEVVELKEFIEAYRKAARTEISEAKTEVAREIIKDLKKLLQPYETEFKRGNVTIENLHCYPTYKGYSIPKYEVDALIAELKKKYTEAEK